MSEEPTARRKWLAITMATVVMTASYAALLGAIIASSADDGPEPGPLFAFGLGLVPFVFIVLAFVSAHRRAPGAVLKAMGLSVLVAVLVSAVLQDAASGLVAGFGAGGVVTLRAEEVHSWRARAIAVLAATAYVSVLVYIFVEAALFAGAILPFLVLGIADWIVESRARSRLSNSAEEAG